VDRPGPNPDPVAQEMATQVFEFLQPVIETQKAHTETLKTHTKELAEVKEIGQRNGRSINRLAARVEFLAGSVDRIRDTQVDHSETLARHTEMLSNHGILLVRILSKLEGSPN
jgi:hypothetical protein